MSTSKLFSTYKLGSIELKNRMVMAPMTRSRAIGNIPNDLMAEYYAQRAEAGLIITEGTSPSPDGLGYARIPGLFSKEQVEGWKITTKAVHDKGGKIFVQLMHTGRIGHQDNLPAGAKIVSPSAIKAAGQMYTDQNGMQDHPVPHALTLEEIEKVKGEFVNAAKNAIQAGFDGIELHSANGYLLEQFIHPDTNKRTDAYGGSIENRSRFVLEVAQAAADSIGKEKVGIRVSPYGVFNDLSLYDDIIPTYTHIAKELDKIGIAYIHVVDHSAQGAPEVKQEVKDSIRQNFKGTYILSGGYTKESSENDLQANKGDLVAFGVKYLSNPDLVTRFKNDVLLNADIKFDKFYTPGPEGFTDYPTIQDLQMKI
ncbi:MAG: alkene reductase [Opitutaceae bacterium]|nr:alkene reductase [Cytophagales bacterium]